jgi:hypothetical protein
MPWWYGPYVWPFQFSPGYEPYVWPGAWSSREQEIAALEDEERLLKRDLEDVRKRLQELRN